jgi:hypothetical protein
MSQVSRARPSFRECPLNNPPKTAQEDSDKPKDGFTQVTGRRKHQTKRAPPQAPAGPPTKNSFDALQTPMDTPSSSTNPLTTPDSRPNLCHTGPPCPLLLSTNRHDVFPSIYSRAGNGRSRHRSGRSRASRN